jgi:hypothetical protein
MVRQFERPPRGSAAKVGSFFRSAQWVRREVLLLSSGVGVFTPHRPTSAFDGNPRSLVTSCSLMPIFSNKLCSLRVGQSC